MWFWRNKQTRKYTHIHNAHIQKHTHVHSMFVFLCINLSNNINLSFCRLYVMISIKNVVLFSRDSIIRNVVTSDAFNLLMIVVERNWKFESEEIVFLFPFSRWFLYIYIRLVATLGDNRVAYGTLAMQNLIRATKIWSPNGFALSRLN